MKEIIDFLEANVNGKTLYTKELVYQLEDGVLEGVYADQISFSNLKYSQSGFQFDMFIVSNEKIWLVGKDGQREALRKDFSGVSLFRFELAKRKSTNDLSGAFRFLSASGKDVAAEAIVSGIYDVCLQDGVLKLSEDQVLYRDQPIRTAASNPLPFKRSITFSLKTKNCITNIMAGVLMWTQRRCSAEILPIRSLPFSRLSSKPNKPHGAIHFAPCRFAVLQ